ncbi:putative NUDIX family NTP pyrophosphohydrolase [Paenarthrobacter histidinolovorans]|uniref:NUDIX family NTP pyrophosphohydrolase n=1 Tax=Paenarthrobacter histidinolovorans TaxID=43664 RepID=A0ABW8N1F4_9MICC
MRGQFPRVNSPTTKTPWLPRDVNLQKKSALRLHWWTTRLGTFRQPSGKIITAFTAEAPDFQPEEIVSNTFPMEWPKGSGAIKDFPEIDDAQWLEETLARTKLVKGQLPIVDALVQRLAGESV